MSFLGQRWYRPKVLPVPLVPHCPFRRTWGEGGVGHGALSATALLIFGGASFNFPSSWDPAVRFKDQVSAAPGIKAASDSHTFMCLGPSLLAVSGPTCNHFAGARVGKGKELSKRGRVGSLPQPATACTQAWACDVVRPLRALLFRPHQFCTDRPGHTPRGARWRLEVFLGPLKGGASWVVCSQCHPPGGLCELGRPGRDKESGVLVSLLYMLNPVVISYVSSSCRDGLPSGF